MRRFNDIKLKGYNIIRLAALISYKHEDNQLVS